MILLWQHTMYMTSDESHPVQTDQNGLHFNLVWQLQDLFHSLTGTGNKNSSKKCIEKTCDSKFTINDSGLSLCNLGLLRLDALYDSLLIALALKRYGGLTGYKQSVGA